MKNAGIWIRDFFLTVSVLVLVYILNLFIHESLDTQSLIPMIFVLGVFIISWQTQGYFWGVMASLASVLMVNYAFMVPYFEMDFLRTENVLSAIVMLSVAIATGTLTEQIKIEEKMKAEIDKERMRANLLRAVSHDLRTPLTSVYGSSSVLIENYDSLSKEQHLKLLGEMREDAQWLIRMVENLLSVTRIDESKVQVVKSPTVLEELIDTVLVKFKKRCPKQDVKVEIPDEFVSIPMDAMLIEQVLINILENAVDHAEGMTELRLCVHLEEHMAVFTVQDNGCGIAPDRMKALFTGYLDREPNADGNRNNMGIGLSVCATIIKAHGSEIFAENPKEGGARFWFALETEEEDE